MLKRQEKFSSCICSEASNCLDSCGYITSVVKKNPTLLCDLQIHFTFSKIMKLHGHEWPWMSTCVRACPSSPVKSWKKLEVTLASPHQFELFHLYPILFLSVTLWMMGKWGKSMFSNLSNNFFSKQKSAYFIYHAALFHGAHNLILNDFTE